MRTWLSFWATIVCSVLLACCSAEKKMKLTYFNAPGRAWAIRACLRLANQDFDDEFLTWEELLARRGPEGYSDEIPLGQVPILTLPSGRIVTQSGAITRYAAKLAHLYPTDEVLALFCDEIIDSLNDCLAKVPQHTDRDVKKMLREEWASKDLIKYLTFFSKKLIANAPSKFIVGEDLTLADFFLYSMVKMIRNGSWEFIPSESLSNFPIFDEYVAHLEADARFGQFKL